MSDGDIRLIGILLFGLMPVVMAILSFVEVDDPAVQDLEEQELERLRHE